MATRYCGMASSSDVSWRAFALPSFETTNGGSEIRQSAGRFRAAKAPETPWGASPRTGAPFAGGLAHEFLEGAAEGGTKGGIELWGGRWWRLHSGSARMPGRLESVCGSPCG